MVSIKKTLLFPTIATVVLLFLTSSAMAAAESFTVHAGQDITHPLQLVSEDRVRIEFVVTGQEAQGLHFYITGPNGSIIADMGTTGNVNYAFICSKDGEYTLHFANPASNVDVLVSLDYEIQHYMFGMPQMLFLTLIVAGLCVAAVAVFILMSKRP